MLTQKLMVKWLVHPQIKIPP